MTVQTIIKKAVKRLELEGKLLTPDFYNEAFCKEATKAGMVVEDCNHIQKFSKTLNKDFFVNGFFKKLVIFISNASFKISTFSRAVIIIIGTPL